MENKIVVLDGKTLNPGDLSWAPLERLGSVKVYDNTESHLTVERALGASILVVNKVRLTKEILDLLPDLKYISLIATGYDNVDYKHASTLKIPVSNISDYSTPSVAQNVFAHLLNIYNRTADYNNEVHAGVWSSKENFSYWYQPIEELKDKTIGLIGFGKIAQEVAKIADAFGMQVVYYSRTRITSSKFDYKTLDAVLNESDIISLHLPLNDETTELMNASTFEKMKDKAILINTARGGLINEADLKQALITQKLRAAGLDVLSSEPPPNDHVLLNCENCFITPHQAWGSIESRQRLLAKLCENIEAFQKGSPIRVIN